MTPKTVAAPLSNHPFSGGTGKPFDITNFFVQNIRLGCSVSCQVGDTCGSSLTGTEISQATATSPFTITAKENVVQGYDKTACFRCTSGATNFDKVFQIVQKGDCSKTLAAKAITSPLSNHDFVNGGSGKTFSMTNFFTSNSH